MVKYVTFMLCVLPRHADLTNRQPLSRRVFASRGSRSRCPSDDTTDAVAPRREAPGLPWCRHFPFRPQSRLRRKMFGWCLKCGALKWRTARAMPGAQRTRSLVCSKKTGAW